jgi:hypothetical protein
VVPGGYLLRTTQGEGADRRRGEVRLQVSADLSGVVAPLVRSIALTGLVRLAAADQAEPLPPGCAVRISPAEAWISGEGDLETSTEPTGELRIEGVLPGRYRIGMDCASGYISAARFGDSDLLASGELQIAPGVAPPPIEAVVASDGGTVDVTASDDGEPGPAWVILLPSSRCEIHNRLARLTTKLTFTGVAPGDYQAYAWTGSAEAFEYADPEARQAWAGRAVSVHVGARDHQSMVLKIAAGEAP